MFKNSWLQKPIKGILCDISGVLKDENTAISGSVLAFDMLLNLGLPYRLLTNETTEPKAHLLSSLHKMGFKVTDTDIISPIPVLIDILRRENLRPHLLVHNGVLEEFSSIDRDEPNCVVVGDAGSNFSYKNLNEAFRKLMSMAEPRLFSLGIGKYYKGQSGLNLDVGAFTKALEYVTGVKPIVVGKPSPEYFTLAVKEIGLEPEDVVMIGDDLEFDIKGAQASGIRGVLVKTGKYRSGDGAAEIADGVVRNLYEAIELINYYNKH